MKVGDKFEMAWPFYAAKVDGSFDGLSPNFSEIWVSGCVLIAEPDGSGYGFSRDFYASAEGVVTYEILSIAAMPKGFMDRVIYKKTLTNPDGQKNRSIVETKTIGAFKKDIASHSPFRAEYEIDQSVSCNGKGAYA